MSSILYESQFAKLESSIHESTYRLFEHMTQMDIRIANALEEFELRRRAMIKAGETMQSILANTSGADDNGLPPNAEAQPQPKSADEADVLESMPETSRYVRTWLTPRWRVPRHAVAFTLMALATPAVAMDHHLVVRNAPFAIPGTMDSHQVPTMAIWTCTGMLFLWGGHLLGAARSLIGPAMGITSVLYFMMRNDDAVQPSFAWGVLSVWSVLALMYFIVQCRRVTYSKIYVLMSLAFSGLSLCLVALVQKSSIQGGLVTAIPPCTSFAAYAVAFAFPDRPRRAQDWDAV